MLVFSLKYKPQIAVHPSFEIVKDKQRTLKVIVRKLILHFFTFTVAIWNSLSSHVPNALNKTLFHSKLKNYSSSLRIGF